MFDGASEEHCQRMSDRGSPRQRILEHAALLLCEYGVQLGIDVVDKRTRVERLAREQGEVELESTKR